MICENCTRMAEKSKDVFTQKERLYVLTSATATLRSIMSGRNAPEDREVANSVITKMLLAAPADARPALIEQLERSAGIRISLGHCAHGRLEVV